MVPGFLSIFELVCRACYLFENFSRDKKRIIAEVLLSFVSYLIVTVSVSK